MGVVDPTNSCSSFQPQTATQGSTPIPQAYFSFLSSFSSELKNIKKQKHIKIEKSKNISSPSPFLSGSVVSSFPSTFESDQSSLSSGLNLRNESKLDPNCNSVFGDFGMKEYGLQWRQFGVQVSPPNCALPGQSFTVIFETLPCATHVSNVLSPGSPFMEKAPFKDIAEHRTWKMLELGLSFCNQVSLVNSWRKQELLSFATKYKPVAKKIQPVNQPMPLNLNPPLMRPPLSRDPYCGLPQSLTGPFVPNGRVTEERLKVVNFGPDGWLLPDELNLIKNVLSLREKSIAFCEEERGLLRESYGLPYIIPVVEHDPWQKKKIPIPAAKVDKFIKLVRERVQTGLYEQSTSSYSSPVFCVLKSNGKLRIVHDLQPLNKVTIKDSGIPPATEEFFESFARRACYGLGDIMGGYDKRSLHPISRPLTTFDTPLG